MADKSAWHAAPAPFTLAGMMESLRDLLAAPPSWPDWLVAVCLVVLATIGIWLLMKLLKWTFYLALTLLAFVAVLMAIGWLLS